MQVSLIPAHNSNLKSNRKCNKLKFKDTPIGFQYFSRFKNLHETRNSWTQYFLLTRFISQVTIWTQSAYNAVCTDNNFTGMGI